MTQNGSLIAHSREWPLYERWVDSVMVLVLSPDDQHEKDALDALPPITFEV